MTHHTYDVAGNLLTASQAGLSLKYNRQPQCGNNACRYDVYGRMVQKPGPGGMWRYGYDSEHRMTEAVLDTPDATGAGNTRHRVMFTYDPFGRRTEKRSEVTVSEPDGGLVTGAQEVTSFVWEGFRLLAETRNGQSLVYVYEGAGSYTPLARIYGTGDKQRVDYYRCSHNGMPQALTDEDGKLHWRQDVDTWGETRSEYADEEGSRWRKIWGGAPEENLRFAGQYLDRETGLHYNTFRYYAPDMGRFITPDPIGLRGGLNLYAYAPNPLSWIDPLGLSGEDIFIHYTDKAGFDRIMNTGVIEANSKGKVYITDILMSPQDAMRDIFINDPIHTGRGDYSIIFKADSTQMGNIFQSSELEYIHSGRLKPGEILHAGKNPYDVVSHLSYEQRLNMTQEQIKSRGGKCV